MITGVHAILYTDDAEATRQFLRDVLELESVDAGGGWMIFALPPAELAAHPTEAPPRHELYFMCDEIGATIDELRAKGVEVSDEVSEQRWGLTTSFAVPGAGRMHLYEPHHPRPGDG